MSLEVEKTTKTLLRCAAGIFQDELNRREAILGTGALLTLTALIGACAPKGTHVTPEAENLIEQARANFREVEMSVYNDLTWPARHEQDLLGIVNGKKFGSIMVDGVQEVRYELDEKESKADGGEVNSEEVTLQENEPVFLK